MPTMYPSRRRMLLGLVSALFICVTLLWSAFLPPPRQFLESISPQSASASRIAMLLAANLGTTTLAVPQKDTGCIINGPLPDPACTPGAVFADAAPSEICVPGYTKAVRSVSTKLKKQIYAAYNIAYPPPTGSYELDHLVPLALGGSNDAANLFPEAAAPAPGFKEKDVVEVYLYEQMWRRRLLPRQCPEQEREQRRQQ